jgi:protein-disulfide isomerase
MLSSRISLLAQACLFALLSLGLAGASCSKDKKDPPPAVKPSGPPAPQEDLPGVKLDGLSAEQRSQFFALIDRVQSPCGKAHSLRTSIKTDDECRRNRSAAAWMARWVKLGSTDEELDGLYKLRYEQKLAPPFDLADSPYDGVPGAPITIVEFFDYTCPHCKKMIPVIEDVLAEFPSDVVLYYKFYPLSGRGHEQGVPCAMAAVAAAKQGKFKQMHKKLFALQDDDQSDEKILAAARDLGLDMGRFEADFRSEATRLRVMRDHAWANDNLEIEGTPAIYINGRAYPPIIDLQELKDWVSEEILVKR